MRSALVWLGEADPVGSMDASKAADPETTVLLTLLNEWTSQFGIGKENAVSSRQVIERCEENTGTGLLGIGGKDYTHTALRSAVLAAMPICSTTSSPTPTPWVRGCAAKRSDGSESGGSQASRRPGTAQPSGGWRRKSRPEVPRGNAIEGRPAVGGT